MIFVPQTVGKTEVEQYNHSVLVLSEVSKQDTALPNNANKIYNENQTYTSRMEINLCQICPPGTVSW